MGNQRSNWLKDAALALTFTIAGFAGTIFLFLDIDRVKSLWIALPMILFGASFYFTHRAFLAWAAAASNQQCRPDDEV